MLRTVEPCRGRIPLEEHSSRSSGGWGRRTGPALTGALVAAGAAGLLSVPYTHWQQARQVPPIHDNTRDTRDPPAFAALVEARERAPNAPAYSCEAGVAVRGGDRGNTSGASGRVSR